MYSKSEILKITGASDAFMTRLEKSGVLVRPISINNKKPIYSEDYLFKLKKAVLLKELMFPFHKIVSDINKLTTKDITYLANHQQAKIAGDLEAEEKKLFVVESRISLLENLDKTLLQDDLIIKDICEQTTLSIRKKIDSLSKIEDLYEQLTSNIEIGSLQIGPPIIIYHDESYQEYNVDVEISVPVYGSKIIQKLPVVLNSLPKIKAVSTLHRGNYSTIESTYAKILVWIENNGYKLSGSNREVHTKGINLANPNNLIEIQCPITK